MGQINELRNDSLAGCFKCDEVIIIASLQSNHSEKLTGVQSVKTLTAIQSVKVLQTVLPALSFSYTFSLPWYLCKLAFVSIALQHGRDEYHSSIRTIHISLTLTYHISKNVFRPTSMSKKCIAID